MTSSLFPEKRGLQLESRHPSRGVAASGFRPLCTIPCCCLPEEWGPCLSPPLSGHALTPDTRLRLGTPLPHQLPDRTRAHPRAINLSSRALKHGNVYGISCSFPQLSRSRGQVTHALLSRLPLGLAPEGATSFDLHALGTPPAFILSQDQTLI